MQALMWIRVAGATVLTAMAPMAATAAAQECDINDRSPFQIVGARKYVLFAASPRTPDEIPRNLRNAIRVLTDSPEKIKNEPGRLFLLVRAYNQWLKQENAEFVMKRGDVGFTQNPSGSHNVLLSLDSAATALVAMMPHCSSTIRPFRDQFAVTLLNRAVEAFGAEQTDSAKYFSKLSLQIASTDPRPWNLLSAIYQREEKIDSAVLAMQKVIDLSGSDSAYAKVKQQSRYNMAIITLNGAESEGDSTAQMAEIAKARALLESFLKDDPGEPDASQALARALRLAGDTTAVVGLLHEMVEAPDKFEADQLFEAGSNAAIGKRDEDATKLFESGLKKNPYHRLALLNFSSVLFAPATATRMTEIVTRLMLLDPNFAGGWRLMAGSFQLKARAETDPAKKKAYGDSTLVYLTKQDKTNPDVEVTLASKSGESYQLQGIVNNRGEASRSWTMHIEFLDTTGAVVATKDVAIGPVEANDQTSFSVKVNAPKAVAFRYAPLK